MNRENKQTMSELIRCVDLCKNYQGEAETIEVLKNVNFSVDVAEHVALLGSSGSGKSTLLHMLGALDKPTSGQVLFNDNNVFDFSEKKQAAFRNASLGFVYQFHHLLPEFNALENVAMPLMIGGQPKNQAHARAEELLKLVGLGHRFTHKPMALSGGERQRVAIARALVSNPQLVLADEPTGNLDHKTGEAILELINQLKEQLNTSFIIVTHDIALANRLDRVLQLTEGHLTEAGNENVS
jgi:lipoprotein-releasing system ATP-binding protein